MDGFIDLTLPQAQSLRNVERLRVALQEFPEDRAVLRLDGSETINQNFHDLGVGFLRLLIKLVSRRLCHPDDFFSGQVQFLLLLRIEILQSLVAGRMIVIEPEGLTAFTLTALVLLRAPDLCHLQRTDEEWLAHEGNRRNGHVGLPAPAGMGCHTGAGKEKAPAALH